MPNGKNFSEMDEVEILELLYAPRPNLERKPEQPFLKGLGWGLLISAFLVALGYLAIMRGC